MRPRIAFPRALPLFVLLALSASAHAGAVERALVFDPQATEVTFDLPATGHDVHGAISLRRGEIRFDDRTGEASGEIVLDAGSADSGNSSRDKTLREDVFEVVRFPTIRFVAEHLLGNFAEQGVSQLRLVGRVEIHGAEHPLTMAARVTMEGTRLSAETEFPVAFVDWGMKDPSVLFLKVEPVVKVHVVARGELAEPATASGAL
jgi:polyisoprenoid-binding protein YceI